MRGLSFLLLCVLVVLGAGSLLALVVVAFALAAWDGGERPWAAVSSVAAVVAAAASLGTAGALGFTVREFDRRAREALEQRLRDRVALWPYVRADVGFPGSRQAGFEPPVVDHIYTLSELEQEAAGTDLGPLLAPAHSHGYQLVVWLSNIATQPLGIADSVRVRLEVAWSTAPGQAGEGSCQVEVLLAYIAPGQTTAIEVARVRPDIAALVVTVDRVRYQDLFGNESSDTHGAMTFMYTQEEVRNGRRIVRNEDLQNEARASR